MKQRSVMKTTVGMGVGMLVLCSASLYGIPSASAAADVAIQAGARHPTDPVKPFEYTRFYPETLKVHRGETVKWGFKGFHTVTFMPAGGPSRPPHLRADEIEGIYNRPEDWWRPTGCGQVGQPACTLNDTDTYISSGVPVFNPGGEFSVTVDVPVGAYRYICTVHPTMEGSLEVVDDAVNVLSQGELDAQRDAELAVDTANAEALEQQDPGFVIQNGRRVWTVLLGDQTPDNHVSLMEYIPASLSVAAGDRVRYLFDNINDEPHTVSFPAELSGERNFGGGATYGKAGWGFMFRCDPDDPLTGAPGVFGPFGVTPLPCAGNLEAGVMPWMTEAQRSPGDMVIPGAIHDSGQLVSAELPDSHRFLPGTDRFLPSEFAAEFPVPGTYGYECNVHFNLMVGSVSVS